MELKLRWLWACGYLYSSSGKACTQCEFPWDVQYDSAQHVGGGRTSAAGFSPHERFSAGVVVDWEAFSLMPIASATSRPFSSCVILFHRIVVQMKIWYDVSLVSASGVLDELVVVSILWTICNEKWNEAQLKNALLFVWNGSMRGGDVCWYKKVKLETGVAWLQYWQDGVMSRRNVGFLLVDSGEVGKLCLGEGVRAGLPV